MQENVGKTDRALRSVVGPGLMLYGYSKVAGQAPSKVGLGAMIAGALLVESAVTRVCPLNALLGIDTRGPEERLPPSGQLPENLGQQGSRLAVS